MIGPITRPDDSEHFGMGPEELYFKGIIVRLLGDSRKPSHCFLELSHICEVLGFLNLFCWRGY